MGEVGRRTWEECGMNVIKNTLYEICNQKNYYKYLKHLCNHVHSSIIHNKQKLETT